MTDGDATEGSKDVNKLKEFLDNEITHSFIGFGMDHDVSLLNGIGSIGKNGYYFIDKLEYAGLVYGEILHGIIYKILDDCIIEIENGLIYNYKTNTWDGTLSIGNIVSEANKTFNIISSDPDLCRITIKGALDDLMLILPSVKIEDANLTRDLYRQRTLQLLYKVNEFCNKKRQMNNYFIRHRVDDNNNNNNNNNNSEKKQLKLKLTNLLEEIKKYMEDNNLNEDKTLKNLCDDIYISYKTLGTMIGNMFCTARLTSQGSQRQYTASNTQTLDDLEEISRVPLLFIQNNMVRIEDDDDDEEDHPILRHEVSDFGDTPYLTPQANHVMREISRTIDDDDDLTQPIY
jgi:AraC-like DNA-binding protein